MTSRQEILTYVQDQYGVTPDYPWPKYPSYAVLRHHSNKKWFAVAMSVPKSKLGLPGKENIDVLNLKCDPVLISLMTNPDILPGYHMNRKYWITARLNSKLPLEEVQKLIDLSYDLTK